MIRIREMKRKGPPRRNLANSRLAFDNGETPSFALSPFSASEGLREGEEAFFAKQSGCSLTDIRSNDGANIAVAEPERVATSASPINSWWRAFHEGLSA